MDRDLVKKVAITVILLVGLGYAGNVYLLGPKRRRLKTLDKEIVSATRKLEKCKEALEREEALKREVAELEKRFEEIKTVLPTEEEIPGLIRQVSKLGYYNRVSYTLFKPGKEKVVADKRYAALSISLEFQASYPQLVSIVSGISGMERVVKPVAMEVVYAQRRGALENPSLKVKCTLETYRYVPSTQGKDKHGKKRKR